MDFIGILWWRCDGTNALGVMNGVYTVVVGIFTVDMVVKTWSLALKPDYYLDYMKKKTTEVVDVNVE